MSVEIIRDLGNLEKAEIVEVNIGPITAAIMVEPDKSDPLSQVHVAAVMRVGKRLAIRATLEQDNIRDRGATALALLIAAVVEHHAEIRDAIAAEKA